MKFPRSFFFALLVAGAIPALAADQQSPPPAPGETQAALTRGPYAQQFLARAGLLLAENETRIDPGDPRAPGSRLNDGVCYTMRMYKVKRTERLAGGESASRGYSTCEWGRNFEVRSIVAPEEGARRAQPQQK